MQRCLIKKLKKSSKLCLPRLSKNFSSALYITGDKAQQVFSVLVPHIDFEERLKNKEELVNNIKNRNSNLDLNEIEKSWYFYRNILEKKKVLDQTRNEISREINSINNNINNNPNDTEKLKMHVKMIKEDLKVLRKYLYKIEEDASIKVLKLPNILHPKTPLSESVILHEFLQKPNQKLDKSHVEIAENNDLLEYYNSLYYFLNHECATFEHNVTNRVQSFLWSKSFCQFSNADFARSIVVEGCFGEFENPDVTFILEGAHDTLYNELSRLHLVGGASLSSFMAYFTKYSIQPGYFPLKFFANGRKYQPPINEERSLFSTSQQSAIDFFIATKDNFEEQEKEIDFIVSFLKEFYDSLGFHYIISLQPAFELKNYESMRVSVQMFSCFLQKYVEVAHLSVCDNYISKRLLCVYFEEKERKFPKILSGTFLNVQKLLGCTIEYNSISSKNLLWMEIL